MPPPKDRIREDDDDDRPRPKKGADGITSNPKKISRPIDDEDDDDSPAPRRKKPKPESSSNSMLLIGGIAAGAVLLLMCCGGIGIGAFFWGFRAQPAAPGVEPFPIVMDGPKDFNQADRPNGKPPVKPANQVGDSAVSVPIDPKSQVRDLTFAYQAPRAAYLFWNQDEGLAKTVDVWDWNTKKRLSRIIVPDDGACIQLSPNGTRFLLQKQFPPRISVWSVPEGQQILKEWDPYPKDPKQPFASPEMIWSYLLTEDRVLTIARSGQFDVWSVPQGQRISGFVPPKNSRFLQTSGFARMPQDFALSPDRKWLAIANGDGFDLRDPATGNLVGKTESFGAMGKPGNIWSCAFNRAGTQLAFRGNLFGAGAAKQQEVITTWDIPNGKRKTHHNVFTDFDTNGPIAFVSPRHLLVGDGNVFKGSLFSLTDGRYHRLCKTSGKTSDRFATAPPDERLWYITRAGFGMPGILCASEVPEADLQRNPAPVVNQSRMLPIWGCFETGIRRMQPNEL